MTDCMILGIVRPIEIDRREGLLVYIWIYGGGKTVRRFEAFEADII